MRQVQPRRSPIPELERGGAVPAPAPLPAEWELEWESLAPGRSIFVDVRSPAEFEVDHIPGSRSVPLLSDGERSIVGALYRQVGALSARSWAEVRVLARAGEFLECLRSALALETGPDGCLDCRHDAQPVKRVIVCARGGLRSEAVTAYLRGFGAPVARLRGGYRRYRQQVRRILASHRLRRPFVLNGLTGTGKSIVLREIARQRPGCVVDLEALAGHRSSLLGDLGLHPVSQRRFESRLAQALSSLDGDWCLFEWEGRRLGDREIPAELYEQLAAAPHIELTAPLEERLDRLCAEYLDQVPRSELEERLRAFARFDAIGSIGVARMSAWLRSGREREAARLLLHAHYDPRYLHGHARFHPAWTIAHGELQQTAREIIGWIESAR